MDKNTLAARAPLLGALIAAAPVAALSVIGVLDAAAKGMHTAQAVTMGFGLVFTVFAALMGWAVGAAVRRELDDGNGRKAALFALAGLAALAWFCGRAVMSRAENRRLDAIREETLTPERAKRLAAGTPAEASAVAWNPTCPPDVLRELAKSPDRNVRSSAAYNPSLPADVGEALLKDADESVRLYAGYGAKRRAK